MNVIKIGIRTQIGREERLEFAEQIGAQGASLWANAFEGFRREYVPRVDEMMAMRERFAKHNVRWTGMGICCNGFLSKQLQGLPGREKEADQLCETIRRVGQVYNDVTAAETPVMIMDQRPTYWIKSAADGDGWSGGARVPGRGGVMFYNFDNDRDAERRDKPMGDLSLDVVWERIAFLYDRIVPVAQEAGVRIATHPDDPPMDVYRGCAQALTSIAGFQELFRRYPAENNGMLLCMGCMAERGEDVIEAIRTFGEDERIFYVHFRNVIGTVPNYTEVFPNMGTTDMPAALRALQEVGYDQFIVPDHHFGITCDTEWGSASRSWQVGYITALLQVTATC